MYEDPKVYEEVPVPVEQARVTISPQPGPQTAFMETEADIAIYGGAAGSGKSYGALLEALHVPTPPKDHPEGAPWNPKPWVCENKEFAVQIFRRSTTSIRAVGALWDQSLQLYGQFPDAQPSASTLEWKWALGGKVKLWHLEHDATVFDYHGAQIPCIIFDELTEFTSFQFWYMLSRNRSTCGVRPYMRATCNPDADSWVAELISWWIDQETGFPIPERSGKLRYFLRVGDDLYWADHPSRLKPELLGLPLTTPQGQLLEYIPKSLTFIAATIFDNQKMMKADPSYLANLLALPTVERERLLSGNWKIRPAKGLYFQRHWVETIDAIPVGTVFKRGWDLAATEKTTSNDPDFTTGTKIGKCPDGSFIVADHRWGQLSPGHVDRLLKNTASEDGQLCEQHCPQDPAQAGKSQALYITRLLGGYPVRFSPETGDKITRFHGFSSNAEAGNVKVLRGTWNERWFTQLEGFPDLTHDDDVDSTSRAFNAHLSSTTGLLEVYAEQARKILEGRAAANPELPTMENGGVRVKSPNPDVNQLYDLKGNQLWVREDGTFVVEPKHAQLLRRSGFIIMD